MDDLREALEASVDLGEKDPAPKDELPTEPRAEEPKPEGQPAPKGQPPAPEVTAPADPGPLSWTPTVRQLWGKLPKEVQAEVQRREREIEKGLRMAADARKYQDAMSKVISPYEAMLKAENSTPETAVAGLLNTAYVLRTGNPQQKAAMVAQIIQNFGIDIQALDQVLTQTLNGQAMPAQPQQPDLARVIQQQLQPVQEFMSTMKNQQRTLVENELTQFINDPKNTYYNDVKDIMANILDAAAAHGVKLTLQDAYQRATMVHPEVSKLIIEEQLRSNGAQHQVASQRAQARSGVSIPSGGTTPGAQPSGQQPIDIRSAVEAAWNKVSSREF